MEETFINFCAKKNQPSPDALKFQVRIEKKGKVNLEAALEVV